MLGALYEWALDRFISLIEYGYIPDFVVRTGIRYLLSIRANEVGHAAISAHKSRAARTTPSPSDLVQSAGPHTQRRPHRAARTIARETRRGERSTDTRTRQGTQGYTEGQRV